MLKATLTIDGDPHAVTELIRALTERTELQITCHVEQPFALIDWEAHPTLQRLSPVEREIMRLDLAHQPRRLVAQTLELAVGTVTVYRRMIRVKLRGLPQQQCPAPVREWLRRFPGQPGAGPRPAPEPDGPSQQG